MFSVNDTVVSVALEFELVLQHCESYSCIRMAQVFGPSDSLYHPEMPEALM